MLGCPSHSFEDINRDGGTSCRPWCLFCRETNYSSPVRSRSFIASPRHPRV